jgi:excinuclease ABC subunit A
VLDLGPEGGKLGGQLVAATTPEGLVKAGTHTGQAIASLLSV